MEAHRRQLTFRRSDLVGAAIVVCLAVAIGEAAIFGGLRLNRGIGFLLGDEGQSLFVASRVLQHARLYRDVAYVYGWVPVAAYVPAARVFGNTPVVYLEFLLFWSVAGLLIGYAVIRRLLSPAAATAVVAIGLVPVFVIPGSLLGGYISAFYIPMERAAILTAVLIWRPPRDRTVSRSAALGAIPVVMQMLKFGPGIILLAAVAALDALVIWVERPRQPFALWWRAAGTMGAAFAIGEGVFAAGILLAMPADVASDVLWPAYLREAYPAWASRWPGWNGWRLLVAQYGNPLAGAILSAVSAGLVLRRSRLDDSTRFVLPPLYFLFGAFSFFRTVDHFRQFAWMFTIGAVPALHRSQLARVAAIAAWLPVFGVVAISVSRGRASGSTDVITPAGWQLRMSAVEAARIEGIHRAVETVISAGEPRPVIFYPSGGGFYVAYGFDPPGRTVWFFSHAVRAYEIPQLERDFQHAGSVVTCDGTRRFEALPSPVRDALQNRLEGPLWADAQCAVFSLRRVF